MSGAYQSLINAAASAYQVPASILSSVIQTESSGQPNVVSSAGAVGLMQVMPSTAGLSQAALLNPETNINAGAAYLSQLYNQYGNWQTALEAYNAGPNGNLAAASGYANTVLANAGLSGTTQPAGPTTSPQAAAGATPQAASTPSTGFYLLAILCVIALVGFGLWGLIKEET